MSNIHDCSTDQAMCLSTHGRCSADCADLINGKAVGIDIMDGSGKLREWTVLPNIEFDPVTKDIAACIRADPERTNICIRNCCEFGAYKKVQFINGDIIIGDPVQATTPPGLEEVCEPGFGLVDNQEALDIFPNLLGVNGSIYVVNTNYVRLTGFSKLRYITGRIVFVDNPELVQMPTFCSLIAVTTDLKVVNIGDINATVNRTGSIVIAQNPKLRKVDGFDSVRQLAQGLYVDSNECLQAICGFIHLYRTTEVTIIRNNRLARIIGFSYTDSVKNLFIWNNGERTSATLEISAFSNMLNSENMAILFNKNLLHVEFESLESAINFEVTGNATLVSINSSLKTVSNNFSITKNPKLTTVSFDELYSIGRNFTFAKNNVMLELMGFDKLNNVDGGMIIAENKHLEKITAFKNLKYVGSSTTVNQADANATEIMAENEPRYIAQDLGIAVDPANPPGVFQRPAALDGNYEDLCNIDDTFDENRRSYNDNYLLFAPLYRINQLFYHYLCNRARCGDFISDNESDGPLAIDPEEDLQSVNYSIIIYGNDKLTLIQAFESMRHTENSIYVIYNVALEIIQAFTKLSYTLDMWVRNNSKLAHFIGLGCLMTVRDMVILDSACLTELNNIRRLHYAQRLAFETLVCDAIKYKKPLPTVNSFIKYYSFEQLH